MSQEPVFVLFPEDWRGRCIMQFSDGAVMLDSGLTTKERIASGSHPARTHVITERDTTATIRSLLATWHASSEVGR